MFRNIGHLNTVLFLFCVFVSQTLGSFRYGDLGTTLYVAQEDAYSSKTKVINRHWEEPETPVEHERTKRDALQTSATHQNISTWTTHLNDSHQQLMVHWVGEGSNVIICLARNSSGRFKGSSSPSALFISYNYGKNFTNKTEFFKISDDPNAEYAQLDKFFNHPKYPQFCVFVDTTNKRLYFTTDNGMNIHRRDLSFHPSEVAFDENVPDTFVVLDKIDKIRGLYFTNDGGQSYTLIQSYVKSFYWLSGGGFPKAFYMEHWKPDNTTAIVSVPDPASSKTKLIFDGAKDFLIKGDFMFATKQAKEGKSLELYISYQRGPFYKAEFQTELDLRKFHLADVTAKRIFFSVMHSESLSNLYVSEISRNFTQYNFVLSLERVLTYFPDANWKDSWLEDVTEDAFTDLYRVEGLKGIYIVSRVESKAPVASVGPENLVSLITFDHGATWSPINPPMEDENGSPFSCHVANSCSLHLCQKFSQLYPVTRSASIMSSKSAPGIIMATGVMGKTLKGIPGVYLSRDAGLTWKRILKDYYFFNFGDHGGVLVAVKYFKVRGETRKILYSTNEGIDWNTYQFNANDLRIYGLMTEPGENTTTFTMFGSENQQHSWIIVTIDLKNSFQRNCSAEDYKFWSPSPPNTTVSCVLGKRDVFHRRMAHTNCYNGLDYERPVRTELCECTRRDFECDYGFVLSGNECVRNRNAKFDPYAVPPNCQPGRTYQKTKGYRKIDGDVCTDNYYLAYVPEYIPCPLEEPADFIFVALHDKIARIDLTDNSTIYPVTGQNHIIALDFDMKNNCIYWADTEDDKINRQCFRNGSSIEVIVETDLASIEGMAFDWISNVLFFVDGLRMKIEAVRTDISYAGRMRRTIHNSKVLSKPRGIAVHPRAGYLFWTDWDKTSSAVSRSNLDGSDVKVLFGKPIVQWPNGLTIDQMSERIYWVDAMEDYIASSDLDGRYFRRVMWNDDRVSHPFAVGVLKDKIYWDDWKAKSIFSADKDTGANIVSISNPDTSSRMMDLKVFAHFMQYGTNACSTKKTGCNTMCLGAPARGFSCLCPDGFVRNNGRCECPNGMLPTENMTCPKKPGQNCSTNQFECRSGVCVPLTWRCNGLNECGDGSDEADCPACEPPSLACDGMRCIHPHWICDGEPDCRDNADEKDCPVPVRNCTELEFQCRNGRCISMQYRCDGDNDCKDNSDEENCKKGTTPAGPPELDCSDGEHGTDPRCANFKCGPSMFRCPNNKCIYESWVCDGENDCEDAEHSDEKNCTETSKIIPWPIVPPSFSGNGSSSSCMDWHFQCDNGDCISYWWRCDSVADCTDKSDERACPTPDPIPEPPTPTEKTLLPKGKCSKETFTCSPGECIPLRWVCDGRADCEHGEDELSCERRAAAAATPLCAADEAPCRDGLNCVRDSQICDGVKQCRDGSDEERCSPDMKIYGVCPTDYWECDGGTSCVPPGGVCDGRQDCYDETDEQNCNGTRRINLLIRNIGVDQSSITADSFQVSCWMPQQKTIVYKYLPSIKKVAGGDWQNMTWINDTLYKFKNLEPYTKYNVTFFISDGLTNKVYPSNKYAVARTAEDKPSPPLRVTVRQLTGSMVSVLWDPPAETRGEIISYSVFYTPPVPPIEIQTRETKVTIQGYFLPKEQYSFWVKASNHLYISDSSKVSDITFDEVGDVNALANVSMARNESQVYLEWHKIRGIDGFEVQVRPPDNYPRPPAIRTPNTNVTLTDLPPGVVINIDTSAYKGSVIGKPFTITIPPIGVPHETLNLTAILLKEKRTSVQLTWSAPQSPRYRGKKLKYVVYYTNRFNVPFQSDLQTASKMETFDTSVTIHELHSCESYGFTVGLVGGPLTPFREIITRENVRAPVKSLNVEYDDVKKSFNITWKANCDVIREALVYKLTVSEETQDRKSSYVLSASRNVSLSYAVANVHVGGRYNVCVLVNVPEAQETCAKVYGPPVDIPLNTIAYLERNNYIIVNWLMARKKAHHYEVLVSDRAIPEDVVHLPSDVRIYNFDTAPVKVPAPETAARYYVGVRSVTSDGYVSNLSEVVTLTIESSAATDMQNPATAIWWGAIAACLAAVAMGGALLHLALRHRRLTRSFLRFTAATPRYDSRRGQAIIVDNEEDVPPISGFSDDEPLVIA